MALVDPPIASSTRNRVLDRLLVHDAVGRQVRTDQFDRRGAGRFGGAQAVGMHGGNGRSPRQDHSERFRDAGHRRGRSHHRAGAGGGGELAFDFRDFLVVDLAGTILRPETPAVSAGAQPLAAMTSGHHGARHQHDRRLVGRYRAHELRRHRLVATAHQDH